MSNFKNFTEKIRCRVIPITRDRRVWLDEKIVDDDLYCVFYEWSIVRAWRGI